MSAGFYAALHRSLISYWELQVEEDDPTPFYEPLLRSFVLGLGVGVIFESGHVALRVRLGHYFTMFINSHCPTFLRVPKNFLKGVLQEGTEHVQKLGWNGCRLEGPVVLARGLAGSVTLWQTFDGVLNDSLAWS